MPRLRRLSGDDVISIMAGYGFYIHSRKGSPIKLRRITDSGRRQNLTVPNHREIALGTLHSIFNQVARLVPEQDLRPYFYTD